MSLPQDHSSFLRPLRISSNHANNVVTALNMNEQKLIQCAYCDKVFLSQVDLEDHMNTVMCKNCKKCFSKRGNLICHIRKGICGREGDEVNLELEHSVVKAGRAPCSWEDFGMESPSRFITQMKLEQEDSDKDYRPHMKPLCDDVFLASTAFSSLEELGPGPMYKGQGQGAAEEDSWPSLRTVEEKARLASCAYGLESRRSLQHCFWEADTGAEVKLEQVEAGGDVYWAWPLNQAEFWGVADGNLVIPLEDLEMTEGQILQAGGVLG